MSHLSYEQRYTIDILLQAGESKSAIAKKLNVDKTVVYSLSNYRSVWQQFINRNTAFGSNTGETANDGLRIGIVGNSNSKINGTAVFHLPKSLTLPIQN